MTTTTRQIRYAKILGNQIRALRKARGLTQAELAFRANMNVTYVGDVERANENIRISKLILLADALEAVSYTHLYPAFPAHDPPAPRCLPFVYWR